MQGTGKDSISWPYSCRHKEEKPSLNLYGGVRLSGEAGSLLLEWKGFFIILQALVLHLLVCKFCMTGGVNLVLRCAECTILFRSLAEQSPDQLVGDASY